MSHSTIIYYKMRNLTHECQQILVIVNNIFASQGFFLSALLLSERLVKRLSTPLSKRLQYQNPVKKKKIPTFNTTICQGFVRSGEDQKPLISEDE